MVADYSTGAATARLLQWQVPSQVHGMSTELITRITFEKTGSNNSPATSWEHNWRQPMSPRKVRAPYVMFTETKMGKLLRGEKYHLLHVETGSHVKMPASNMFMYHSYRRVRLESSHHSVGG